MAKFNWKPQRSLSPEQQEELEARFVKLLRNDPIVRAWYDGSQSGGLLGLAVALGEYRKVDKARIDGAMALRCPNPEAHGR